MFERSYLQELKRRMCEPRLKLARGWSYLMKPTILTSSLRWALMEYR